ncbi:transposase [Streptosporangium sp. KLBMP 9127]|nr:transposase [Streptosporangium sp. KLBMP 9127]
MRRRFLLTVLVTAASVHDSAAGAHLLDHLAAHHPTLTKASADNGYKNKAIEHAATRGIDLESSNATPTPQPQQL